MFENLSSRLTKTLDDLSGRGKITEANIQDSLKQVRKALLEADVALPVVKEFIGQVKKKALGSKVLKSLTPGQALIKIVQDELTQVMGESCEELNLKAKAPVIVLMAGLQGAGKTTSVAKLGRWLLEQKKSVMVASVDVYRPAAVDQLQKLVEETEIKFFPTNVADKPAAIAKAAVDAAQKAFVDVLLVDTAGRLAIDEEMMAEIKQLHTQLDPTETLFVVDAMTGQDAANTAKAFGDTLPLTGVVVTKMDGDARGGAALSVRSVTGKPIKFVGIGEKTDALEAFHPDRMASRILGMGDVITLVEQAEKKLDKKKAEKLVKKVTKGKGFNFHDMLDQFQQVRNLGGMSSIMDKLPGMGQLSQLTENDAAMKGVKEMESIILSMTHQERSHPDLVQGKRKQRIARGAGVEIQDVNRLLKQNKQMQKMMKRFSGKGGSQKMLRSMQGMGGPGGPMG